MHSEAAGAVEAVEVDEADEAASGAVVVLRAVELEAEMIALDAVVTATIVTTGDATIDVAGVVEVIDEVAVEDAEATVVEIATNVDLLASVKSASVVVDSAERNSKSVASVGTTAKTVVVV